MAQSEDTPLALVVDDDEVFRNRLCRAHCFERDRGVMNAQTGWSSSAAYGPKTGWD